MAQGDTKILRRNDTLARAKTQAAFVDLRFIAKKFDYYFVNSRNYITADYSMNPSLKLIQQAGLKKLNELAERLANEADLTISNLKAESLPSKRYANALAAIKKGAVAAVSIISGWREPRFAELEKCDRAIMTAIKELP